MRPFSASLKTPANETAPEGSTTNFIRSQRNFIAEIISFSETVMISSTFSLIILKVISPKEVRNPSAIVPGLIEGKIFVPSLKDKYASLACSGSIPNTNVFGEIDFVYNEASNSVTIVASYDDMIVGQIELKYNPCQKTWEHDNYVQSWNYQYKGFYIGQHSENRIVSQSSLIGLSQNLINFLAHDYEASFPDGLPHTLEISQNYNDLVSISNQMSNNSNCFQTFIPLVSNG